MNTLGFERAVRLSRDQVAALGMALERKLGTVDEIAEVDSDLALSKLQALKSDLLRRCGLPVPDALADRIGATVLAIWTIDHG